MWQPTSLNEGRGKAVVLELAVVLYLRFEIPICGLWRWWWWK
jgi:hypothetical protein